MPCIPVYIPLNMRTALSLSKAAAFFPCKISDASGGSQTKALSRHLDYTISQQDSVFFFFFEEEKGGKGVRAEIQIKKEQFLHCKESCWCLPFWIGSAASSVCVGLEGATRRVDSLMINYSSCQTRRPTNFFPVTFHTGTSALFWNFALPAVFPARCCCMHFDPRMPISLK